MNTDTSNPSNAANDKQATSSEKRPYACLLYTSDAADE